MKELFDMLFNDLVYCERCGMKKHSVFMPGDTGTDVATLRRMDATSKCCENPAYYWVLQ